MLLHLERVKEDKLRTIRFPGGYILSIRFPDKTINDDPLAAVFLTPDQLVEFLDDANEVFNEEVEAIEVDAALMHPVL